MYPDLPTPRLSHIMQSGNLGCPMGSNLIACHAHAQVDGDMEHTTHSSHVMTMYTYNMC